MAKGVVVTADLFRKAILIFAVLDCVLIALLAWRIKAERFHRLKWPIALASLLFWGAMWTFVMWGPWWEMAYQYVFPTWSRYVVPPLHAVLFGAVGLLLWRIAKHRPGNAVIVFCVLGGLVSLPGHLFAIYQRRMFEKTPLLRGADPALALIFGISEFIAYYGIILFTATLISRFMGKGARGRGQKTMTGAGSFHIPLI